MSQIFHIFIVIPLYEGVIIFASYFSMKPLKSYMTLAGEKARLASTLANNVLCLLAFV